MKRTGDGAKVRTRGLMEMTNRSSRAERSDDGGDEGERGHDSKKVFVVRWMGAEEKEVEVRAREE